jgi:very-short-patch-repair endonuclease
VKYNIAIVEQYFSQQGLPEFVTELKFAKHLDEEARKFAFDFAWLGQRIALEVEGGIWIGGGHSRPSAVKKDMVKYNLAAVLGWRVLRCEPKELCTLEMVNMLKKVLL